MTVRQKARGRLIATFPALPWATILAVRTHCKFMWRQLCYAIGSVAYQHKVNTRHYPLGEAVTVDCHYWYNYWLS